LFLIIAIRVDEKGVIEDLFFKGKKRHLFIKKKCLTCMIIQSFLC